MNGQTGDFANTATTALEITQRIRRDLDNVRTALVGRDETMALHLMREFFNLSCDDATAVSQKSEHDNRKQARGESISPDNRAFAS